MMSDNEIPIASDLSSEKVTKVSSEAKFNFAGFQLDRIIRSDAKKKVIVLLGKYGHLSADDNALIVLEKSPFTENHIKCEAFRDNSVLREQFVNDVYMKFDCTLDTKINDSVTTIIYPATAKHIEKYSTPKVHVFDETPELYENIVLPYVLGEKFSLNWLYNILEHKKETERIIFEDPDNETGFILLPDIKWDGITVENLYYLAIVRCRNIRSLRDLNGSHLPVLKNIRDAGVKAISDKFGIHKSQLRIYIHYHPSFYHLHIHMTHLGFDAPGINCEKSHPLTTVISNLELNSSYYSLATLPIIVRETDRLYDLIVEEETKAKK